MASEEGERKVPFDRKFRLFARTQRFPLSCIILGAGIVLTVLAVAAFTPLGNSGPFPGINNATNPPSGPNYDLVFVFVGPIVVVVGMYMVGAYFVARRKFEHLMRTKSKAEFLRNLPEVEDLLWELTPADEIRYEKKKIELRIRR